MTNKQWIILSIAIAAIILIFGAVKLFPFWYTIVALISFIVGVFTHKYISELDKK